MTLKELELQRIENLIFEQLPPLAKTFILNSPKVVSTVEKYENLIMAVMNEDGTVNGTLLNAILSEKYPEATKWINIPKDNFYLKDEIEKILSFIFK